MIIKLKTIRYKLIASGKTIRYKLIASDAFNPQLQDYETSHHCTAI